MDNRTDFYIISGLIAFVINLFIGIYVYKKNPRGLANRYFGLFSLSICGWSVGSFLVNIIIDKQIALFVLRCNYFFGIWVPSLFLYFIYSLTKISQKKRIELIGVSVISCLMAFFVFTPLFIKRLRLILPWNFYISSPGPVYYIFFVFFTLCTLKAVFEAYLVMIRSSGLYKLQLKYIILSYAIAVFAGLEYFTRVFNILKSPPIDDYILVVYFLVFAYAIIKYRLMDITVFAVRGLILFFVYGVLLFFPLFTFFSKQPGIEKMYIGIYALFASGAPFVYMFLRKRVEDIMLREQRQYQEAIVSLSKKMIEVRELDDLLKMIPMEIWRAVRAEFCVVYIKDDGHKSFKLRNYYPLDAKERFEEYIGYEHKFIGALKRNKRLMFNDETGVEERIFSDSELIIPCFGKDGLLGMIVLGKKPNGRMYTADDLLVFENMSYSTSLAIENCVFWKQIEERQRLARVEEMNLFSYSLAHEIDNPMTIIIGNANKMKRYYIDEMGLRDSQRDELRLTFDQISEAAWRVSGMVKAIQEFGEKTSGEAEPVGLKEVADNFLRLYAAHFKMSGVEYTQEIAERLPLVMGVAQEIEQVLVILANNAVHAVQGMKEKRIGLKIDAANPSWVRLEFTDNGYGIRKDNLLAIFSAFVTTKASSEGTGMGLYNAKSIVTRHNGNIWAESAGEGRGAKFIVELPAAEGIKSEAVKKEKKGSKVF